MTSDIKAIIFDFGGVLLDWDPRNLYHHYFPQDSEAMERFLAEVDFLEWNSHQDKGRPFREGVAELSSRFPRYRQLIQAFHENWERSVVGPIAGTVEIAKELRQKGYPLYGLSNWSAETFPIARRKYPIFNLFDDILISGEVNLIKPDPAIFQLFLERIRRSAHECLLIDDSDKNISTAQKLGFDTILFTSAPELRSELRERHILP